MEVFSLVGKIAVNYSDAISKIDKVSNAADDAADSLNDVSDAAEDSQNPIKGSGNAASDADSKFSAWQLTLANLAANAIQGIINKVVELGKKLGEFAAASVSNFAEFEQLAGGTELMFGEAAEYVMKQSEKAYKTVQMSQNDYLQQVNGFAVGLKTALGGNEQAAAELAHKIITAEADIVAATGNSQEAVQNAFNGIMKSNYTMLDNLQLGITPTKEGFQEVIDKVNEWNAANGRATQYQIENLADCQAALVDYVEMQGLAGYASNEAGSTIQGSWSSVLALFDNIKTKVGKQLAPVVMNFLQQLSAWMDNVDWDEFAAKLGESFGALTEWISQIDFTTFFQKAKQGVTSFVEKLGDLITKVVSVINSIHGFSEKLKEIWPIILGVVTAIASFSAGLKIVSIIKGVATALSGLWAVLMANPIVAIVALIAGLVVAVIHLWNTNEDFRNAVIAIWNAIKGAFQSVTEAIKNAWNSVKEKTISIWNSVKETVTNAWNTIKSVVQVSVMLIKEILTAAFNLITLPFRFIWENCKDVIITVWNAIKSFISSTIQNIKDTVTEKFNAVKDTVSTIFNAVKTFIISVFSAIWSVVSDKLENIKTAFSTKLQAAWSTVSSIFNSIKSTVTSIITSVWSVVSDKLENIKTAFSSKLNAALSTVSSIFESIKSTVQSKIDAAKEAVRSGIEQMKSFFNFTWSLPHIKLPHFSISGSFSLNPPSAPHFSVEWYRKGAILTNPAIFGFNPYTGKAMGAGEAGNEAIAPIDTLQKYVKEAVAEENTAMLEILSAILSIVSSIDENMADSLYHALLGLQFKVNDREFARLVKAVS